MIDALLQDIRYAARMLRRSPGFTAVAVATLALGIGANASVFSLLNAALFREVDAAEPSRLVWLVGTYAERGDFRGFSYPEYLMYRARDSVLSGVMTYQAVSVALGGERPERISGLVVTGNYFAVLGMRPALGRTFAPEEDATPLTHPVVVISHDLWRRRFASDSGVIGAAIVLNGQSYTVIGVAPRHFTGVDIGQPGDVFVPMAMLDRIWPGNEGILGNREARWLRVIARRAPGVTIEAARARVATVGSQLAAAWPDALGQTSAGVEPLAGGLDPANRREGLPVFMLLMAVPAMVLLIACANAANLLLSRATARRREIGLRLALGATRARLVRMLVAESLLLALAGGALGVLASVWITDAIAALGQVPSYITDVLRPDGRVLAFAMTLAVLTGLLFGLVPAFGATRRSLAPALKDAAAGGMRTHRSRLMSLFVVAQVAVSLVLLIVAGLFLRTLSKATRVDVGFDPRNGLAISFDLPQMGYDVPRRGVFYEELLARAAALPGVTAATLTSNMPLSSRLISTAVLPEGAVPELTAEEARARGRARGTGAALTTVWPNFFRTLGLPLVAGRDFTPRDDGRAPGVVIVNETLARRLWPGQSPLGKRLTLGGDAQEPLLEVVGVARDAKYDELTEDPRSFIYLPERQQVRLASDMTLLLRTAGDPGAVAPAVRGLIRGMDRNLPLFGLRTLEEHVLLRLDKERAASALLGAFGVLALVLATLGLYGVMSYAVTQRTREIGIRMALGAARREVLAMVVKEGLRLSGVGIAIGLVLAAGLTRVIQRFLFGVTPTDAATFAFVAALLAAVAAAASLVPARRATRVDPMVALRAE